MRQSTLRIWLFVHKWTSLICTAFLLMLCVTGLPLIFHDEIDAALDRKPWTPAEAGAPLLDYDVLLQRALENRPGEVPLFASFDLDRPVVNFTTGPRPQAPESQMHFASFDRTNGALVPQHEPDGGVMHFLLQLHTDMFLGLPGMLFLGVMGTLLAASLVSGVVVYAPFARRQVFGALRTNRSSRVKWLDYHNLHGIVTVLWLMVVGLTGTINAFASPITGLWRQELQRETIGADHKGIPQALSSLHLAIERAQAAVPDMQLQYVAFPGVAFSTDRHYAIFFHGKSPLTAHLTTPVLIDAETGSFAGTQKLPWYVTALALSRPLHFGDYGGLPLKIIWALLDVIAIIVLGTGLYLWLAKARTKIADSGDAEARPLVLE